MGLPRSANSLEFANKEPDTKIYKNAFCFAQRLLSKHVKRGDMHLPMMTSQTIFFVVFLFSTSDRPPPSVD